VAFFPRFPSRDEALALTPEDLGWHALAWLLNLERESPNTLHRQNFIALVLSQEMSRRSPGPAVRSGEQAYRSDPAYAEHLEEMWAWLFAERLIAHQPGQSPDFVRITDKARRATADPSFRDRLRAVELLKRPLHPTLEKVRRTFEQGDYDTAINQAFKAVELAVRDASGQPPTTLGVDLMTQAYRKGAGPLADQTAPEAEQDALMHFFRGAFGAFRNPASHRDVDFDDPDEAAEIVLLADLLMRITDRASARLVASPAP
jgi:uncharacterized protein (TIGR02391 family)